MPCLLCVPILVHDPAAAVAEASHAKLAGADLVEFRFDTMLEDGDDIRVACRVVADAPLPCIVTCRIAAEGGAFDGEESLRLDLYRALAELEHPPRYFDIELQVLRSGSAWDAFARRIASSAESSILVSTHDFKGPPADLSRRLLSMRDRTEPRVLKIAYMARSIRDNLELFRVLQERDRPTIALAMGESGLLSRVLAPKFGGFLTFASLRATSTTAPGQPTVGELLGQYRFRSVGPRTKVYGVMGSPVAHSLGPVVHNAGFEAVGHDGVYVPLPVAGDEVDPEASYASLKASVLALLDERSLDFAGCSVTLPHKENLLRLALEQAWEIDEPARAIGAANTLVVQQNGVRVLNTDAPAIASCVGAIVGELRGRSATVLGAGGVGRAAAYALAQAGMRVRLANRSPARAEAVAREYSGLQGGPVEAVAWDRALAEPADVLVQATSVGMAGGSGAGEAPVDLAAAPWLVTDNAHKVGTVLFETVYRPLLTPLVAQARCLHLRVIDGVSLFVAQAAAQFAAWTHSPAPADLFRRIVDERLSTRGTGDSVSPRD